MKGLAMLLALTSFNVFAVTVKIEAKKLSGVECTKYLKDKFKYNLASAYQVCSAKTDEAKICLIKNRKLKPEPLAKKCKQS